MNYTRNHDWICIFGLLVFSLYLHSWLNRTLLGILNILILTISMWFLGDFCTEIISDSHGCRRSRRSNLQYQGDFKVISAQKSLVTVMIAGGGGGAISNRLLLLLLLLLLHLLLPLRIMNLVTKVISATRFAIRIMVD